MTPRCLPAVLTGAVLAAACTNSSGPQSTARGGSHASIAPTVAATAAATPTPLPALASCKLPVASGDAPVDGRKGDGTAGHGGFVTIPGGTFNADPASLGTYDRAVSRWLPVTRAAISPDGSRYAWAEYPTAPGPAAGTIHIVDASSGADKTIAVPAPSMVVSYESEGVYVHRVVPASGAPPQGLVQVDPVAGTFHQIIADGIWTTIGGGFAFGVDIDTAVALPSFRAWNRVRKLDLHTGAVTNVASFPGATVDVLGANGPTPIIAAATASTYTVSMGATTILSDGGGYGSGTGPAAAIGPVVIDGATVWMGRANGTVYSWTGSAAATAVATTSVSGLQIAGACR